MPPFSPDAASRADHRANRAAIRAGSRSFYAASFLLPPATRRDAFALYAFCRLADDAVDLEAAPLAALQARVDAAYRGRPWDGPADRAFADLVRRRHIPRELPDALIEGFAWDAEGRRYEDIEALHGYAARVAGAVGAMMTLLMGVRDPAALARACDLGAAMQLTNIARDVGEDAALGRLYLPLDWLRRAGLDPDAWLAAPAPSPALAGVVARLLGEADRLYARAEPGVARLPASCRPAILAASRVYAEIGREVARRDHDSVTARARVGWRRKLTLIAGAGRRALFLARRAPDAPLPAAAFLVEAVERRRSLAATASGDSLRSRFVRVLEIFERLERADQMGR